MTLASFPPHVKSQSAPATTPAKQPSLALFATGMIGLGILGLAVRDFAMGWQPVAPWFPARTALACIAAIVSIAGGAGLLFPRTAKWASWLLLAYLVVWNLLKVPALVVAPKIEGVWLGFGELAVLLAGGIVLFALLNTPGSNSPFHWLTGQSGLRIARYWFAVWLVPIGLSHILYVPQTVALVPAWLPHPIFWAYLTGAGQMASGLGILFGVWPRAAAFSEAIQISLYTLLIWAPRVMAQPKARLPWTAFWISFAIGSAAWVVAQNVFSRTKNDPANS